MLFYTGFPRSILVLLDLILPFTNAFSRLKAVIVISVDCCLQFFCGKLFFYFRLLSYAHSLLLHHVPPFSFSAFSLLLPVLHKDGRGVGMGEVGLSGELHCGSCQVKEYGLGMRTANHVTEPRTYSKLCQAPQRCLTLFCISEFVLNQWTLRQFGIRSTVTVQMHTSYFLACLPSCFLKQMNPSQKIVMTFLRSLV